jgi:hypothetical protein
VTDEECGKYGPSEEQDKDEREKKPFLESWRVG